MCLNSRFDTKFFGPHDFDSIKLPKYGAIFIKTFKVDYYDKIERNGMHILEDWRFIDYLFGGWQ